MDNFITWIGNNQQLIYIVILMIFLGIPEVAGRSNFRNHPARP